MLHTWPLVHVCEFECVRGTDVVVACTVREGAETLDDKFYRDLIMNFIIAGRDTTANALSWCIYTITTHPAVETKVGSVCMCRRAFVYSWSLSVDRRCGVVACWCMCSLAPDLGGAARLGCHGLRDGGSSGVPPCRYPRDAAVGGLKRRRVHQTRWRVFHEGNRGGVFVYLLQTVPVSTA